MSRTTRVSMLFLSVIFCALFFTGCQDAREIDDEVYTIVLGVDKGVNNKVQVTIQYPTYKSGGGGEAKKKEGGSMGASNQPEGTNINTVEASTIIEALDMFGMSVSRRISLMHGKILIFSEEFAQDGVGKYLAPMARFRETRRNTQVLVVKGKAKDFMQQNVSNIGESLAKAVELMISQGENTAFFPRSPFHLFYQSIVSPYQQAYTAYAGVNDLKQLESGREGEEEPPLAVGKGFYPGEVPRDGVVKRDFSGTAVFDGDKMVGALDSDETRYFLMVADKFRRGIITIRDKYDPEAAIPLDMRLGRKTQVRGYFENGKPVIAVKLQLEGDIGAIQSRINYERASKINDLNIQAKEHFEKQILQVIQKTQTLNSDIFGFGHKLAGYFPTIPEWEEYNWKKHYGEAEIRVDVGVNIRRTGLMINSSPVRSSQGVEEIKEDGEK